jgi:excisionase family DNA binding protein
VKRDRTVLEAVPSAPTAEELCAEGAMTFPQGEKFTGLSRRTLYRLVEEERLHQIRVRGRVLLARRELVGLLAEGLEGDPE